MTDQERTLFAKLADHRREASKIFNHKDFKGGWMSVCDKYSESAHFIYELLQNADDVQASHVEIILGEKGLIFKHNGKVPFDITDVDDDSVQGHINALLSIGHSSKIDLEKGNTIGKFGVGFKSVFLYSDTPEVYDDNFKFRIRDLIVPEELTSDHEQRKPGETLFYFPYSDQKAYEEIKERLESLDNPILFLHHIQYMSWREELDVTEHEYSKDVLKDYSYLTSKDLTCHFIAVHNSLQTVKMLMFQRIVTVQNKDYPINVAYYIDKVGNIDMEAPGRVFCFFPTQEKFANTHFICHAPFLLIASREHLKPKDATNEELQNELAYLAADSLPILRDIGIENKKYLLGVNLFKLISLNPSIVISYTEKREDIYYTKQSHILDTEPLLLCQDGQYRLFRNCFFCHPRSMYDLLSGAQLNELMGTKDTYAFVDSNIQSAIANSAWYDEYSISAYCKLRGLLELTPEVLSQKLTEHFFSKQPIAWLSKLYRFLNNEVVYVWKDKNGCFRSVPFIKTSNDCWVAPYTTEGNLNIFLPIEVNTTEYNIVHPSLLENEQTKKLLESMGVSAPSRLDYITNHLLAKYRNSDQSISNEELVQDFDLIVTYYSECKEEEKSELIIKLGTNGYKFVCESELKSPMSLYMETTPLMRFFENNPSVSFFNRKFYSITYKKFGNELVEEFIECLGVKRYPAIQEERHGGYDSQISDLWKRIPDNQKAEVYKKLGGIDYQIEGLSFYLSSHSEITYEISTLIWDTLLYHNIDKYKFMTLFYKVYHGKSSKAFYGDSSFIYALKNCPWLFGKLPKSVTREEFKLYDLRPDETLFSIFEIEEENSDLKKAGFSDEQIKGLKLAEQLKKEGATEEDIQEFFAYLRNKKRQQTKNPDVESDHTKQDTKSQTPDDSSEEDKRPTSKKSNPKSRKDETRDLVDQHEDFSQAWQNRFNDFKSQEIKKPHSSGFSSSDFSSSREEETKETDSVFGNIQNESKSRSTKEEKDQNDSDINKSITEAQNNIENALNEQDLRIRLAETDRYSFEWFALILGLQKLKAPKENKIRDFKMTFQDFSLSPEADVLILHNSLDQIPNWAEDAASVSLAALTPIVHQINASIISVDANMGEIFFNVRDVENIADIVEKAKKMVVIFEAPSKLLESLMINFSKLPYESTDNLKELLPSDIEFIYGPPGTGKTTELIRRMSLLVSDAKRNNSIMNILVLTPTNKAADVIAEDIILNSQDKQLAKEIRESAAICRPYTSRYGNTNSEVYKEEYDSVKTRENMWMTDSNINILATTIDRYAYDYIQPDETLICDFPWNYIICDEASMLDLVKLMYVLHKAKGYGTRFIIAGDPKQIPSVNLTGY